MREIVSVAVSISPRRIMQEGAAVIVRGCESTDRLLKSDAPVLSSSVIVMHSVGERCARPN